MNKTARSFLVTTAIVVGTLYAGAWRADADFIQTNLVSDIPGLATITEPNLKKVQIGKDEVIPTAISPSHQGGAEPSAPPARSPIQIPRPSQFRLGAAAMAGPLCSSGSVMAASPGISETRFV